MAARQTIFALPPYNVGTTYYSNTHPTYAVNSLHLIQVSCTVPPALPRTHLVELLGANGSIDLTEALGVGVTYQDRVLTWVFALYPGADWDSTMATVSNALNGQTARITLDTDPDYYWEGRISITEHATDRLQHRITVTATVRPYKIAHTEGKVSRSDLASYPQMLTYNLGRMPQVPTITVGQDTVIRYGIADPATIQLAAGTHVIPDLYASGLQSIQARRADTGTGGTISITWREGSL